MRCLVIAGAEIKNYDFVRGKIRSDDFAIYCDSGLYHQNSLGIRPDLIVGDFDSHPEPVTDAEVIRLPREKDDTDTVFAVKEAVRRGFDEFLLVGVIGGRFDHTFANVSILVMLHEIGRQGQIVDDYSVMELAGSEPVFVTDDCAYFSLLNITGEAENIDITGAKYPLQQAQIRSDYQYGVSNEVLPGQTAQISVGKGMLLLIKVYRDIAREI